MERVPDGHDRRAKIVRLTRKGSAFMRDAAEVVSRIWQDYAEHLGADELAELQERLGSLLSRARAGRET